MTENRKCIYCGRSLETDMFFCPRCGRPVPADRMEDTRVFSLFEEKNIPSVPVMRTAHLVDTGVFPVIKEEDYPEKKTEKAAPAAAEPAAGPEERTKPLPAVKEVETEKPEDTKQLPVSEEAAPAAEAETVPFITADEESSREIDLDAYLKGMPADDVDPDDDLDLSFMETMSLMTVKDAEPAPVRKEKTEPIVFPVLPEEKEELPEETVTGPEPGAVEEKEPEVASFANSNYTEPEEDGVDTGEIDVLGDLQSVLKTLLADEGLDPEEDKLTGGRRDSRPSDNSYDVPFVLRRNPVSDEDTKAALKLAGLDQEGREDTRRNDIRPFGNKNEEETIIYPGVFEPNQDKKMVDEGRTVVFQPEEQNFEPIRPAKKAEEVKQPEPEVKEEPKDTPKPASRKEKRREKALPPEGPAIETKKSALPMYLLIALLLALIAVLVYFLFFRGNGTPVEPAPVKPAETTAEPAPATTPEPTAEATPEATAETTPEATAETTPTPTPTPEATPTPTPTPAAAGGAIGKVLVRVDGLNIRSSAGTAGQILGQVKNGTEYEVYADPVTAGGYTWYKIAENEEKWIADNGNWLTFTKN